MQNTSKRATETGRIEWHPRWPPHRALQRLNLRLTEWGLSFNCLQKIRPASSWVMSCCNLKPKPSADAAETPARECSTQFGSRGWIFQRLDLASWQEHPDVVTQQVLLLNDTIAAKAACTDGFIRALPAGTPS